MGLCENKVASGDVGRRLCLLDGSTEGQRIHTLPSKKRLISYERVRGGAEAESRGKAGELGRREGSRRVGIGMGKGRADGLCEDMTLEKRSTSISSPSF